ncbi:MAG: hypothetical protein A3F31_04005 [Candidatus Levybacteria bacterium RIFCSPHIGHO2_12_FULL_38_12]|nr:MAG: hypothetical protein A2770_02395 [Candidatus Levybacteria bacterium RIFCSPHIGHO2_01_FULL_38_12]OGH21929.1 MAG: hypothetical protein A3D75_00615 [Candidatus Levybacteria bacterium RIFCSPHIGHO2_02_FULL_37_18]OGH22861.1 MAG: hypothetical protein A3F31_04005 [Candidatus Levybacteria bacterium RIFCSPHIGHO2_12_FULL_38_12]OGH33586.1 MAG: hypothetical protein A3A47_01960 [Candidatus Levybacteria bacterium RIFCSPLOWO2_01_FULL_37_20]OGH44507.1 MAG: hypothetical protein A3J14_03650 [Candidatus Lev
MEFILAFLLGLRHGVDIDHVAAISDITSSQTSSKKGIEYVMYYIAGHGLVVLLLGGIAIFLGKYLPKNYDRFFEAIVGITLIILGVYVFFSLFKNKKKFRLKSRWMIIFSFINYAKHRLLHCLKLEHDHPNFKEEKYSSIATLCMGMIHGVGAETPTQVVALSTLAGIGVAPGALFLGIFLIGIFTSNVIVTFLTSYGYLRARQNFRTYALLGVLTAVFSLIVGVSFLLEKTI